MAEMTPDARLSAAERAALANLEAAAVADDPRLAARLRGTVVARVRAAVPRIVPLVGAFLFRRLSWLGRPGYWGAPLVVAGLLVMIVGLGSGLVIELAGALLTTSGLLMLAGLVEARLRRRPEA